MSGALPSTRQSDLNADNPWADGHSIETLRRVAAGIVPDVGDFEAVPVDAGGVHAEWIIANGNRRDPAVVLYLHGGAYLCGHPGQYRNMTVWLSRLANVKVLAVDYRLAPEHPFPAAFDDALSAYRWLLDSGHADPAGLVIAGDSAGAGLAVSLTADAMAAGLPSPAGVIGNSPYADMSLSSASLNDPVRNRAEPNKTTIEWLARTYLTAGKPPADAKNPRHSPVYRDLSGLPPLLIQTGGMDNLQDDGARLAEKARRSGVEVTYTAYPESPHIWPVLFPADKDPAARRAITEMAEFIAGCMASPAD